MVEGVQGCRVRRVDPPLGFRERPLEERMGLGKSPKPEKEHPEVGHGRESGGMVRAEKPPRCLQVLKVEESRPCHLLKASRSRTSR
ncbi:MAG: hypothetical protein RL653_2971 [Pseudomonadota bacterium]|jgi:hypothetical protein